jgi:hypothetical protein
MFKPGASRGNNTHYRIRFFQVKGFPKKNYIDTTADKATHYQVFQNNKGQGEFKNLKDAIDLIIEQEGKNQELDNLIDNIYYVQNPAANFITAGIVYTPKHGVRIEQILRA